MAEKLPLEITMSNQIRTEPSRKRVRAMVAGQVVADSVNPLLVWEIPYFPTYYFPRADLKEDVLVETGETRSSPSRGIASLYDLKVDGVTRTAAAYTYG